jgi:hypothetical protein
MRRMVDMMHRCRRIGVTVVSLSLLWSFGMPAVISAQGSSAICVLKIAANGSLLGILTDAPQDFNIAVSLPLDRTVNVPILCESLGSLALAVANNEAYPTTFSTQIFTHDGVSICVKGGFEVPVNGGRGVTFASCL